MEKRNFVTSVRTSASSNSMDDLVKSASDAFSTVRRERDAAFEKKASREDEKTDIL